MDCEATFVANVSYHLAAVASGGMFESELTEQSSSIGQSRLFPTPFGRTSNHHSSESDSSDILEGSKGLRVRSEQQKNQGEIQGARACLFFFLFSWRLSCPRFFLYCLAASSRALLSDARAPQR